MTWKEQRAPCTYDIPSLTDNFCGIKEDKRTNAIPKKMSGKNVREIKNPAVSKPKEDSFLKTNALARQWHGEIF